MGTDLMTPSCARGGSSRSRSGGRNGRRGDREKEGKMQTCVGGQNPTSNRKSSVISSFFAMLELQG